MANDVIAQVGYEKRADNCPDTTKVALLLSGVGVGARSFTTIDWKSLAEAINATHAAKMEELREDVLETIDQERGGWAYSSGGAAEALHALDWVLRRKWNMAQRGDVPFDKAIAMAERLEEQAKEQRGDVPSEMDRVKEDAIRIVREIGACYAQRPEAIVVYDILKTLRKDWNMPKTQEKPECEKPSEEKGGDDGD